MILTLACDLLGLKDVDDRPAIPPDCEQLNSIVAEVVHIVWSGPNMSHITSVLDPFPDGQNWDKEWCLCGEGKCHLHMVGRQTQI